MTQSFSNEDSMFATLRDAVETGEGRLVEDGRLPTERELMKMFGVSRRAVRRTLDELQREGLVFRRQGQGTFIKPTSLNPSRVETWANRTSPFEIMEVRCEIEPAIARLAARRATPSDIDQLRRLAERGGTATNSQDYERWDSAFHTKIAESARNDLFFSVLQLIQAVRVEQKWTGLRAKIFNAELRDTLVSHHMRIVDAIAERDSDGAGAAMYQHLQEVSQITQT